MNPSQWFNQHAISFTLILAYIPLIATIVTTVVSLVLTRATLRYTASSDRSLALAREQFEREWAPELHLKLERHSNGEPKIIATNLAKISVLMQMVQLRRLSMAVPSSRCFINEPLVGGTRQSPVTTQSEKRRLTSARQLGVERETRLLSRDFPSLPVDKVFLLRLASGAIRRSWPVQVAPSPC